MLISGFFQWRTSKVWGEISAMLPSAREALRVARPAEVTTTGAAVNLSAPIGDINVRLLGAIEQLEKRIQRLEQGPEAALRIAAPEGSATGPAHPPNASTGGTAAVTQSSATAQAVQISALLNQGQTCLKENDLESALRFFEQALSLNPNEAEVLVKKGVTLERMQRPTEAIDCYDRAIAADAGMTSAYLRKGSLYNRAERFKDALECYEQALQAQEESGH
jgi:tetratricopeptide (TPR) repeat protein